MKYICLSLLILHSLNLLSQGIVEADTVEAAFKGDGSRLTGLPSQNLAVSMLGDTLYITEGNFVIIPGLSASNSGNAFANAGPDIINACETSFNLSASPLVSGTTGQWSIISGSGGNLFNDFLPNALFVGAEGESYVLKWTVQHGGGSTSFDQVSISIAINTETSIADAGQDLFAIMNQSVILNGNIPEVGSTGRWEILNGIGGILSDLEDPTPTFSGVPGESYTLRWQHYNECSVSSDEVVLTFSESAAGAPSSNGRYFIPDPKFRLYLQIAYPSAMDGDSLITNIGEDITNLRISNLEVSNLDGLQFLTNLIQFEANNNSALMNIPYFSPLLNKFSCQSCPLKVIPDFPLNLDTIIGSSWRLTSIPIFPSNLSYLQLSFLPNIIEIPQIPETCKFVSLNQLGPGFPPKLMDSVNIPNAARFFQLHNCGVLSFPKLPTESSNLEQLYISNNRISSMPSLIQFTNLIELEVHVNELFVIDSLPPALEYISMDGNPIICVKNKPLLVEVQMAAYEICPPTN